MTSASTQEGASVVEQEAWSSSETGKGGGWAAAAAERRPIKGASKPGSAACALAVTVWRLDAA